MIAVWRKNYRRRGWKTGGSVILNQKQYPLVKVEERRTEFPKGKGQS